MKTILSFTLFTLSVLVFVNCSSKKKLVTEDSSFAFDFVNANQLSDVLDEAQKEGKLVFLDIYTTWCLPCKMMERDVFTHQGTADIINADFISYKVDAEKGEGPDLKFIYEVNQFPTLLFLDSKGKILVKYDGSAYHTELIKLSKEALRIHKENG